MAATRHHRDVLACMLITLGAVIWLGGMISFWFRFEPLVLLLTAPITLGLGTWTAAMVLDDLDRSEAALAGGLAVVFGLGLRQLDAREAPALWMLGPCALGVVVASITMYLARKVARPRRGWLPLASGLVCAGTSTAALVIAAIIEPGSNWIVYSGLLAMAFAGAVAYALVPGITAAHLIPGSGLIVCVAGAGFTVQAGVGAMLMSALMGAFFGLIIGAVAAALGFWARPRANADEAALARARVVTDSGEPPRHDSSF